MKLRGKVALAIVMAGAMGFGAVGISCGGGDDSAAADDDASPDVVHHDAGTVVDEAATACTPDLPAGYSSTWVPPLLTNTACTSAQVQAFYDQCFDTAATSAGCQTFFNAAANADCVACMYTPQGSAAYGAIVALNNNTAEANIGGCLALVDGDKSANGCGAKYEANQFCGIDACPCSIDSTDPKSFTAYTTCTTSAASSVCSGYVSDAGCEKDSKYSACTKATSFEGFFVAIGNLMCSSGNVTVTDAGTDASDDAATDASDDASDASDDADAG